MMSEMIERVARAMAYADKRYASTGGHPWDVMMSEYERQPYLIMARAAIEAMHEPTKEMIDKAITAAEGVEDWTQDSYERYRLDRPSDMPKPVWQAMIDAALK